MQAVCLHRNAFGQYCERKNEHTGNHRCRVHGIEDAQNAYYRCLHVGDNRWQWVNGGWQTTDPELVAEGMERLLASKEPRRREL